MRQIRAGDWPMECGARARWVLLSMAMLVSTGSCGALLREGLFQKNGLKYRVIEPAQPLWKRVEFAENDLAWAATETGHLIAMNSTCKDHGDPSLEVLTNHLLMGFEGRVLRDRRAETIDGRAALRSCFDVIIDGVPAEVEVVVLKKNGCVHDFTYVSPKGQRPRQQATFDGLVSGFSQEAVP